jgi:hypothetical protein
VCSLALQQIRRSARERKERDDESDRSDVRARSKLLIEGLGKDLAYSDLFVEREAIGGLGVSE